MADNATIDGVSTQPSLSASGDDRRSWHIPGSVPGFDDVKIGSLLKNGNVVDISHLVSVRAQDRLVFKGSGLKFYSRANILDYTTGAVLNKSALLNDNYGNDLAVSFVIGKLGDFTGPVQLELVSDVDKRLSRKISNEFDYFIESQEEKDAKAKHGAGAAGDKSADSSEQQSHTIADLVEGVVAVPVEGFAAGFAAGQPSAGQTTSGSSRSASSATGRRTAAADVDFGADIQESETDSVAAAASSVQAASFGISQGATGIAKTISSGGTAQTSSTVSAGGTVQASTEIAGSSTITNSQQARVSGTVNSQISSVGTGSTVTGQVTGGSSDGEVSVTGRSGQTTEVQAGQGSGGDVTASARVQAAGAQKTSATGAVNAQVRGQEAVSGTARMQGNFGTTGSTASPYIPVRGSGTAGIDAALSPAGQGELNAQQKAGGSLAGLENVNNPSRPGVGQAGSGLAGSAGFDASVNGESAGLSSENSVEQSSAPIGATTPGGPIGSALPRQAAADSLPADNISDFVPGSRLDAAPQADAAEGKLPLAASKMRVSGAEAEVQQKSPVAPPEIQAALDRFRKGEKPLPPPGVVLPPGAPAGANEKGLNAAGGGGSLTNRGGLGGEAEDKSLLDNQNSGDTGLNTSEQASEAGENGKGLPLKSRDPGALSEESPESNASEGEKSEQKSAEQSADSDEQEAAEAEEAEEQAEDDERRREARQARSVAEKEARFQEAVRLVNPYINALLIDGAIWVWALALPSFGFSVLVGAILGDLLWKFKDALVKRAIGRVLIHKTIVGHEYDADAIAKQIKFSSGVKLNIVLMNVTIGAVVVIFIVLVAVVGCQFPAKGSFSVMNINGFGDVCKTIDQVGGDGGGTNVPTY